MAIADQLNPTQLAVYEVYRRLHASNLPSPTIETVSQLAQLKGPTVVRACEELLGAGHLKRGGRSIRSFRFCDSEIAATEVESADAPSEHKHSPAGRSR